MKILHSEASPGWGGQEMRILKEAVGMRGRGHEIIFATQRGGSLSAEARKEGFLVYEVPFSRRHLWTAFRLLKQIIKKHQIELINTHSSFDAWFAGFIAKLKNLPVIRTRHLSTPIKGGINALLLYNFLADHVITTCEEVVPAIARKAKLPLSRCQSIPTGVNPETLKVNHEDMLAFREKLGVKKEEILVGTLCILRGWKGVADLLYAAKMLEDHDHIKWVVVGGGVSEEYFLNLRKELGLEKKVIFTGYLPSPGRALSAMDIFLLLSRANEGVSQASLQAAWLKKPLITTNIGGLKEVSLHGKTGFIVPPFSPSSVAEAVLKLSADHLLRKEMGEQAHRLVENHFTVDKMLDAMEGIYSRLNDKVF